ncbi:MAG: hypothetical protein E7053_01775 [Lentisphaerae bacterium]|nr:hypothetical protein [Lentisphaerota bacterium]
MSKVKYLINIIGCILLFCGCAAPKALDENYFCLDEVRFIEPGILELNGEYAETAWGILELRGKVEKDTLTLSGTVEFWGDDTIQHRITIPESVNIVKCGNKILWTRGENLQTAIAGGSSPESAPVTASTPETPDGENGNPPVANEKDSVTHLMIGGNSFNKFRPRWPGFENIFFGEPPVVPDQVATIRQIGADNAIYNFNGQTINEFQNLEVLEIRGTTYIRHADLSGLSLPKLRVLVLDQIEVTGLESANLPALEEFYLNDMRTVPLGKISLPAGLDNLHTVGIQAYIGNFDFSSLAGKPLTALWVISDCKNFEFLRGMPLKHLQLNGFSPEPGALEVLRSLPLESLSLQPFRAINDWNFLSGLRLKRISINVSGSRDFSLSLLRHMPLEVLRIKGLTADVSDAWMNCCNLPLKELVLFNCRVPEAFLRTKPIESIALYQCLWPMDDPLALLNNLPGVKHLAVWRMIKLHNGRQYGMMDRALNWNNFIGRGVESLCISTADLNFLQKFPGIKKVFIREINTPPVMESLSGREFEIFSLPFKYQQEITRCNIKITGLPRLDMLTADW